MYYVLLLLNNFKKMNRCHWVNRTYSIFHLMRRLAAKPQIKPVDLGCESAENWQLPSTSTIASCYYYSAHKLILTVPSVYWGSYRPHPPSPIVIIAQRVSWYSLFVTVYSGCERWRSRVCTGARRLWNIVSWLTTSNTLSSIRGHTLTTSTTPNWLSPRPSTTTLE